MKQEEKKDDNCLAIGISMGLSFGSMIGVIIDNLPMGASFGMLIGMIIASLMSTSKQDEKAEE